MIIVKVNPNSGIESALKSFKYRVNKTKLVQEIRDRSEYVKPSVKRRKEIQKASYIQKLRDQENL